MKALKVVFSIFTVFSYIILGKKTSVRAILCCLVIIAGFILGVNQEDLAGLILYFTNGIKLSVMKIVFLVIFQSRRKTSLISLIPENIKLV